VFVHTDMCSGVINLLCVCVSVCVCVCACAITGYILLFFSRFILKQIKNLPQPLEQLIKTTAGECFGIPEGFGILGSLSENRVVVGFASVLGNLFVLFITISRKFIDRKSSECGVWGIS